ncbi:MAG: hypothetical protein K9M57_08930, partial [Phycisphaerae bacterium]|nr:hypothetical protein [Phycisphaerae bacterium]
LVVISIIALLVAILMPALGKARKQARAAVCLSNIKQWTTIIFMYTNENEDKFWYDGPAPGAQSQGFWMRKLKEGYGDVNEFRLCPSASKLAYDPVDTANGFKHGSTLEAWDTGTHSSFNEDAQLNTGSYGINLWLSPVYSAAMPGWGFTGNWLDNKECHWGKVWAKNANSIPTLGDCAWFGVEPQDLLTGGVKGEVPLEDDWYKKHKPGAGGGDWGHYMGRVCMDRHGRGVNWGFMDASARKVPLNDIWSLQWHRKFQRSQNVMIAWLD